MHIHGKRKAMDIPAARKREFNPSEITFVQEAICLSGLDPVTIKLEWDPHMVSLNGAVEIHAVLFDCRGLLDTPCWLVRRLSAGAGAQACGCGELVREAATGTYGSLKTAVAAAIAEVVRLRVLENTTDPSQTILKERTEEQQACCQNDFITQCVRS